jgi:hypothetical protein
MHTCAFELNKVDCHKLHPVCVRGEADVLSVVPRYLLCSEGDSCCTVQLKVFLLAAYGSMPHARRIVCAYRIYCYVNWHIATDQCSVRMAGAYERRYWD